MEGIGVLEDGVGAWVLVEHVGFSLSVCAGVGLGEIDNGERFG